MTDRPLNQPTILIDAIAEFVSSNTDMEILPMVTGFTLQAQIIDPDNGQPLLVSLQDNDLPVWVEWGMLAARMTELTGQWQMMGDVEYGEIEEEEG